MIETRGFAPMGDRYMFDFKLCTSSNGWAQLDTDQDAPYFGIWINPIKLQYVEHIEGDQRHIQYENELEFQVGILVTLNWQKEHGHDPHIDGMCNPEIIAAFERLGFKEWLH